MNAYETVLEFLAINEIEYEAAGDNIVVASVPGIQRKNINVVLACGEHYFRAESFVARNPDENHEAVYRWVLEQNLKLVLATYGIDQFGDIYLSASMPLATVSAELIDQLLGVIVTNSDAAFNTLIELGFRSSIEKEWAWRTSRGLPTDNLQAFAHLFESD
jgi:hypothetical protein